MPILFGRYWYLICYIPLAVLQPFINKMLLALTKKQHCAMCLISIVLFTLIPTVIGRDLFIFNEGYSFVWLVVCYMIGACLRRMEAEKGILYYKYRYLCIFLGGSVLLLIGNMFLNRFVSYNGDYFISYTSPIILLMALGLLLYMKNIKVKRGRSVLPKLSSVAFDVYIIHCHMLIYDNFLKDRFIWIAEIQTVLIPLTVVGWAIGIYYILSLVGMIRSFLFEKIRLNRFGKYISGKVDKVLYLE